jgi:hypothetical protein
MTTTQPKPRVLVFSQRNIFKNALFRCPHYEFEDVISRIDSAELLAPRANPSTLRHSLAKKVCYHVPVALNPGIPTVQPKKHYDLFFAICGDPSELLTVCAAIDWRECCTKSICLIDEVWVREVVNYRNYLRLLDRFDLVLLYYSQSVTPVAERTRSKVVFLPPGVDGFLFCPYPSTPHRAIDVYSIGRRSELTHQKLLQMSDDDGFFYLYDSITGEAIDTAQHRALFANLAKRSRYFIVNPGLIDRPDIRGHQMEIGNRYFEGAAAGAIMLGECPDTAEFRALFDWPDALIHVPFDSTEINRIIKDLDEQPERQKILRRMSVAQALLRHDWAYRWESILRLAELEPMPQLLQRKEHLHSLAENIMYPNTARVASV